MTPEQQEAAIRLANRCLDPEDLGYTVGPVTRDLARQVIGIAPCESYLAKTRKDEGRHS